jgi:asparagine synthase (glutamine-hydrolysing)
MMHGVDVWYPFRDRDLAAFLMAVPGDIVNWQGIPKGLLREAQAGILPDAIRNRRWKADFTALDNQAARRDHPAIARLLAPDCLSVRAGFVDGNVLEESVGKFATTVADDEGALPGWALTDVVGLELWLRNFTTEHPASMD